MRCKSIDDCTSTSRSNLPSSKLPRKNRIEKSDTTKENTQKETITEPKNAVHGSYNNKKDKILMT